MEQLINYKRRIASRFLPLEGDAAQQELPESEEFVYSEKLDGHLAFAVVAAGKVSFYNRSATPLNLPGLEAAFPKEEGVWAGELYIPKERSRSFLVSSAIANAKDDLSFAVFDCVHLLEKSIVERIAIVEALIPVAAKIHPVKWLRSSSKKEILSNYEDILKAGKEGLIVHPAHGMSYKLKPSIELDLTVIGYSMKEDGSGIRSLLVGVKDKDEWLVVASVGGGYSEEDRAAWVSKLEPMVAEGDIVLVAKNKLAYKWIKPEIVIQVKCIEAIAEDADGVILKEVLRYDDAKGYLAEGKRPGVSLVSPVFMGVRADKKPGAEDTGINQLTDRIELGASGEKEDSNLVSEILFRKVYTKESKTGTGVRKFVGVKTNREKNFPRYYLYFTDFSAGRKDPLKTEIDIASSEDMLKKHLDAMIEENIKKGWELVS